MTLRQCHCILNSCIQLHIPKAKTSNRNMCHMVHFTFISCYVSNYYFFIIYSKPNRLQWQLACRRSGFDSRSRRPNSLKQVLRVPLLKAWQRVNVTDLSDGTIDLYNKVSCNSKYGTLKIPQLSMACKCPSTVLLRLRVIDKNSKRSLNNKK